MSAARPTVVIVGAGFGGLRAAKALRRVPVNVVVLDRHNYHLFQPLLYQVATAALNPSDIAVPIRHILHRQKNPTVLMGDAVAIAREPPIGLPVRPAGGATEACPELLREHGHDEVADARAELHLGAVGLLG